MEFTSNAESQFEKLPTFIKWLKSQRDDVEGKCQVVTTIWFPSKFPNITLDTESYRLRIPITTDNELELVDMFEQSIESQEVLAIRVEGKKDAKFTVTTLENERGDWEELGETGYKCTVLERPTRNKRVPKKPVSRETLP